MVEKKVVFFCEHCHMERYMASHLLSYEIKNGDEAYKKQYAHEYHIVYYHLIPYLMYKAEDAITSERINIYDSVILQPLPMAKQQLTAFVDKSGWMSDFENYCIAQQLCVIDASEIKIEL